MSSRQVKLFLVSLLILYFELLFIRWIPDAVHVLSFLGNFVLLSCFLGMGVGLARSPGERTDGHYVWRFLVSATGLIGLLALFLYFRVNVPPPNQDVFFNDDAYIQGPRPLHLNLYVTIALFCTLVAVTFIPLGTLLRRYLDETPPLYGYSLNILASLLGIGLFSLLSFLQTGPPVWLTLGLLLLLPLAERKTPIAVAAAVLTLAVFSLDPVLERAHGYEKYWSPYYNIRLYTQKSGDLQIHIGNSCLLTAVDLSPEKGNNVHRVFYAFPYQFRPNPERVLVMGSGMGNDVAMALLEGAKHVDAVEIDPLVAKLGRIRHPLHPYLDPRVTVYNDDARHFLSHTQNRYDLIIFGTLDSHGLFSHMTSLKMENYVYTQECFEQAKKLLTDQGVLYVTVGFMGKFVPIRLHATLQAVFGKEPQFYIYRNLYSMFIAGNPAPAKAESREWDIRRTRINYATVSQTSPDSARPPTDDWPQLYLRERKIPREYLAALGVLLLLSLAMIRVSVPTYKLDWHFFFLGSGFMLLETKSISEMGLLFGSTWITSSVVIGLILGMIFGANLYLLRAARAPSQAIVYALLGISLVVLYAVPVRRMAVEGGLLALIGAVVALTVPLLFAALIFGTSFARTIQPGAALASNILGSMVGGALEYTSMMWGLKALYLVALVVYLLSFLLKKRG